MLIIVSLNHYLIVFKGTFLHNVSQMILKIKSDYQLAGSYSRFLNFIFFKKSGLVSVSLLTLANSFNSFVQTPALIYRITAEILNNRISILLNFLQSLNSGTVSKMYVSEYILSSKQNGGISKFKNSESISFLSTEKSLNTSQTINKNISEIKEKIKIEADLTTTNLTYKNLSAC